MYIHNLYFDLWKKKYNEIEGPTSFESLNEFLSIQGLVIPSKKSFDSKLEWNEVLSKDKYNINDIKSIPFFIRKETFSKNATLEGRVIGKVIQDGVIVSKKISLNDLKKFSLEPMDVDTNKEEFIYIFNEQSKFKNEFDFEKEINLSLQVQKFNNSNDPNNVILKIQIKGYYLKEYIKYVEYSYLAYPGFNLDNNDFIELGKCICNVRNALI